MVDENEARLDVAGYQVGQRARRLSATPNRTGPPERYDGTLTISAPMRLSLAGGGTDLPEWYRSADAHLLSAAINWHVSVSVSRDPLRHTTSQLTELFASRNKGHYAAVSSEVSPGSGLGGSGALAVCLVAAERTLRGLSARPHEVAEEAYRWERDLLSAPVGFQDHYASAFGSIVEMTTDRGHISAHIREDLTRKAEELISTCILLVATGRSRDAASPLGELAARLQGASGKAQVGQLASPGEIQEVITNVDGARFGNILMRHWEAKKLLNPAASSDTADRIIAEAIADGSTGGKLIGAGLEGFVMVSAAAQRQASVRSGLERNGWIIHIPELSASGLTVRKLSA